MKVILTGGAGFIGSHVASTLAGVFDEIFVIDSINDYYDVKLKLARLAHLGVKPDIIMPEKEVKSQYFPNLTFRKPDIGNISALKDFFEEKKPDVVCHLAAQPGVRSSILYPELYMHNNVIAFFNLLV